jgi:hypothetical protein
MRTTGLCARTCSGSLKTKRACARPRSRRRSHRPVTLYKLLQERHVLVASDSVPQGFERRVDNLAAAVIVHVGNYRLIQPRQSGVIQRFGSALGRM